MISRRHFLTLGSGLALSGIVGPASARPLPNTPSPAQRSLHLVNLYTQESDSVTYWMNGRYVPAAMERLNYLMRDHKTDSVFAIDPALYDLVWNLRHTLKANGPLQIVCGYRTQENNAAMRRVKRGVAKNSYHMQGKAIDLRISGISVNKIGATARGLKAGGVGVYRGSQFVHVDTGPVRSW